MRFLVAVFMLIASSAMAQSVIRFALTASDVQTAVAGFDDVGRPEVRVQLTPNAADRFERLTCANIGQQLELTVGDRVVIAAKIAQCIPGGALQISGNFTLEETQAIARSLDSTQPALTQSWLEKIVNRFDTSLSNLFGKLLDMLFRR